MQHRGFATKDFDLDCIRAIEREVTQEGEVLHNQMIRMGKTVRRDTIVFQYYQEHFKKRVIEQCSKKKIFAPLKDDELKESVKYQSDMDTKFRYSMPDAVELRSIACKNGKVGKVKPEVKGALLHQYESFRREATRHGFSNFQAELGFGAFMGQVCNKKVADIPWANTDNANNTLKRIDEASGRHNNRSILSAGDMHTHVPKLSDISRHLRSVCPQNNPTKMAVKNAENMFKSFVTNHLHGLQKSRANELARVSATIQKAQLNIERIHKKYEDKADKFKIGIAVKLDNLCEQKGKRKEEVPF